MSADQPVQVELDLTDTLAAMVAQQVAAVGATVEEVLREDPASLIYLRQQLLDALLAGLPTLTEAIVDTMPSAGWLHVPSATREDLARLGLRPDPAATLEELQGPHSRACGIVAHKHGRGCHPNCPTCGDLPRT